MMQENQALHTQFGAIGALLDEYHKAIGELKAVIAHVTPAELVTIVDVATKDPNCKSIQTVMAHVVRAGYTYAILIDSLKGPLAPYRERIYHTAIADFMTDLDAMYAFNVGVLSRLQDADLEGHDPSQRIVSPWGQTYDAEQLLEHAIVHILRHRRQLERFLRTLRG
jgi:uncharacterized damage-inducible protein DinB